MKKRTVAWYLRQLSRLLNVLSEEEMQRLIPLLTERHFRRGEVIFAAGDPSERLYLILKGRVKVFAAVENGKDVILDILSAGDIVGEMALVEGGQRKATAEAITETATLSIGWADFQYFMSMSPQLGIAMAELMGRRLLGMHQHIQSLVSRPVAARLAWLLLSKATSEQNGETRAKLQLTHQEMAQLIGTSRETITALLSRFQTLGMIQCEKKEIILLDRKMLERCAEGKLQVSPRHPAPLTSRRALSGA